MTVPAESSEQEEKAPRRQTCQSHCGACNQHFAGIGAFDAHRRGGYCNDASEILYGADSKRSGQSVLQAWTLDGGYCDKEHGCWVDGKRDHYVEGVTIWQVAATEEQREALAKLGQSVLF